MARFATQDDGACMTAFLADPDESGFVNGQALAIDGGSTTTETGNRCAFASNGRILF